MTVANMEIETSSEMRDAFAALLEKSFESTLKSGAIVIGEVIRIERDGLVIDVGGKSEGFAPLKEIPGCNSYEDLQNAYQVGQVTEFFVIQSVDKKEEVNYILSIRRVNTWKNWDRLADIKEAGENIDVVVSGVTKGGVIVNVLTFKGFIPASQLRVAMTLQELVGQTVPAKILEVDKKKNKLILSHREAVFEQKAKLRAETMNTINEGDVVEGHVVKITDFGAFVDINGIDGLLPLSEITWRRIQHPSEVLTLGQALTVRVLTVDKRLQRISLSLKRLEVDPWDTVTSTFSIGDRVEGRISKLLSSGVLGELTPGVEAYCPYGAGERFYKIGESYPFEIISIAVQDRRITLAYRG
ncbi:MAG: S1 RNA-binding domain-containing protein [Vampirovibrionales bacterium]|nr:S1 RNA-binding domain-containing protein [Vampirovibrionales bacterium]